MDAAAVSLGPEAAAAVQPGAEPAVWVRGDVYGEFCYFLFLPCLCFA